ncbi:MAG TPA: hypothetical protein VEA69_25075 [Tepidisphaeraceae bacterium]|nr:hypothetical protein [Tepidisphaeraceae bacterium]
MPDVSDWPLDYTAGFMDHEMNFPNPVVRTDLPTRRRRWPKLLAAMFVLLALAVVFLPQILSTKVGRRLVVAYLVRQTGSRDIVLDSFKTSWFGGTEIKTLWVKDALKRRNGFESLKCDASLWNLIRGNYKLGEATVVGMHIDYVVNDGRGGDSRNLWGLRRGPDGAFAGGLLPKISGNIKIVNGRLALWRGSVQQRLYDVKWQAAEFRNINGQLAIASLDQPWTYELTADTVDDEDRTSGPVASAGTVDLGAGGIMDPRQMKLDLTVAATRIRTAALAPVLIPGTTHDDAAQLLGPSIDKLDVKVKADGGKVAFEQFDAIGPVVKVNAPFTLDVSGPITTMMVGPAPKDLATATTAPAPSTITLGVTKRLAAGWLAYLSPFFRDAAGGGTVTVSVDALRAPLSDKTWRAGMTAKGRFTAANVTLARLDEITGSDAFPKNLASQLALLTGDEDKTSTLSAEGPFSVSDGKVAAATKTTVGTVTMAIEGTADLETTAIAETAQVSVPPAAGPGLAGASFAVPLTGELAAVQIGLLAPRGQLDNATVKALGDRVNQQVSRMREKETQRLMNKAQAEVQSVMRPFQGLEKMAKPDTAAPPKDPDRTTDLPR